MGPLPRSDGEATSPPNAPPPRGDAVAASAADTADDTVAAAVGGGSDVTGVEEPGTVAFLSGRRCEPVGDR